MLSQIPLSAALLCPSWATLVEDASMLQMPVASHGIQSDTDEDDSECRCPGYYESDCTRNWWQGCSWGTTHCTCDDDYEYTAKVFTGRYIRASGGSADSPIYWEKMGKKYTISSCNMCDDDTTLADADKPCYSYVDSAGVVVESWVDVDQSTYIDRLTTDDAPFQCAQHPNHGSYSASSASSSSTPIFHSQDYMLALTDQKCPHNHEDRLFREPAAGSSSITLTQCYDTCAATSGCEHFSYGDHGGGKVCMGCTTLANSQGHAGFNAYNMIHSYTAPTTTVPRFWHTASPASWEQTREECIQAGGDLVVVNNQQKNALVEAYIQEHQSELGDYPWNGARNCVSPNCEWVDGSTWDDGTTWEDPVTWRNAYDDLCGHFYSSNNKWGTHVCDSQQVGICERKKFWRTSARKTWSAAREECIAEGGDLVVVQNAQKDEEVKAWISPRTSQLSPYPWSGFHNCNDDGCTWVDGSSWDASFWNDVDDPCGHYYTTGSFDFGTWDCGNEGYAICERTDLQ